MYCVLTHMIFTENILLVYVTIVIEAIYTTKHVLSHTFDVCTHLFITERNRENTHIMTYMYIHTCIYMHTHTHAHTHTTCHITCTCIYMYYVQNVRMPSPDLDNHRNTWVPTYMYMYTYTSLALQKYMYIIVFTDTRTTCIYQCKLAE